MNVMTPRTPRGTAVPFHSPSDYGASHRSGDGSGGNHGLPPLWVLIVDDRCVFVHFVLQLSATM